MKRPREVRQKHESCVGASLLTISIRTELKARKQARSYEKQNHAPHVGASLLAITTPAEPEDSEQARSYEKQKHDPRFYRVAFGL